MDGNPINEVVYACPLLLAIPLAVRLAGAEERLHLLEAQSTEDQLKRQDAQAEARVLRAEVELLRRQVAALQEQLDESGSQCEVRH